MHGRREVAYFEALRKEIAKFKNMGQVMLCGDFNARLGNSQEVYEVIQCNDSSGDLVDTEGLTVPYRYNEDLVFD